MVVPRTQQQAAADATPTRTQPARRAASLPVPGRPTSGLTEDGMLSDDDGDGDVGAHGGLTDNLQRHNGYSSPEQREGGAAAKRPQHPPQPFSSTRQPFQPQSLQAHLHAAMQRSMQGSPGQETPLGSDPGAPQHHSHPHQNHQEHQHGFASMLLSPPPPQGLSAADLEIRQLVIPPSAVSHQLDLGLQHYCKQICSA